MLLPGMQNVAIALEKKLEVSYQIKHALILGLSYQIRRYLINKKK